MTIAAPGGARSDSLRLADRIDSRGMSVPKRHHFVPQMILNGFTDPGGWLHWCRHREDRTLIRPARPAELFLQNHLYSTLLASGIKDPAMERFLAVLESEAVGVVQSIIEQGRRGIVPKLTDEQKQIWYLFFSMQWRRTPETQRSSMSDDEAMRMIDENIERLRLTLPDRIDVIEALALPDAKARVVRNVRIGTLVQFSAEVMGVLVRRGIGVLHNRRARKSFIIGSRPVVKLTMPGRTDLNETGVEMWLPIASDIAVGVGLGGGNVTLHHLDDEWPIRQLNPAIAGQSGTIAAGAKALVRSIAHHQ